MICPKKGYTLAITKVINALRQIQAFGVPLSDLLANSDDAPDAIQDALLLARAAGMSRASYKEENKMKSKNVFALYEELQELTRAERNFWLTFGDKMGTDEEENFIDLLL